jgi:hypothetical protein
LHGRLRHRADSLEEASDKLFAFTRLPPEPMEERQDHQRDRALQATHQDADRAALCRDRRHAVLGAARVGQIRMRKIDGWQSQASDRSAGCARRLTRSAGLWPLTVTAELALLSPCLSHHVHVLSSASQNRFT